MSSIDQSHNSLPLPLQGTAHGSGHSPGQADGPLKYRRIVAKAGTSVLTRQRAGKELDLPAMSNLVRQISYLRQSSAEVLLVTSGAIAAGRAVLGPAGGGRTPDIPFRQVLAAVGQGQLMQTYQELFANHQVKVAQALLTVNDLSQRNSYLNVRNTLIALLELGVVPILNENDVVAVDEIGEVFGDNDRLSALVANLIDADVLIILTDIDGLYTADPRVDPAATLIPVVEWVDASIEARAGLHRNSWSRGGMPTKIEAAKLVTTAGIPMIMCNGRAPDAVLRAASGQPMGTLFHAAAEKLEARKRWMLSGISHRGEIVVDHGAARALHDRHGSLLPAGVKEIKGDFQRGDIVYIRQEEGQLIACGIASYGSGDVLRIRGFRSDRIQNILGYHYGQEVVHRNNLVLL